MKIFLAVMLLCNVTLFAIDEPLSAYDGSTPIIALFGDPMPEEWFTKSYESTYDNGYQYWGQVFPAGSDLPLNAVLVNESEATNALIISGVHRSSGLTQNFLVQIPSMGETYIDAAVLREYNRVFFMSAAPFRVFFSEAMAQQGLVENELVINQPVEKNDQQLGSACSSNNCARKKLRVTNSNGPGMGGFNLAYFHHITRSVRGQSRKVDPILEIYYPGPYDLFHKPETYTLCDLNTNNTPQDYYRTRHTKTGRSVYWWYTSSACQRCEASPSYTGWGICQDTDCNVATPTGSQKAKWTVSCSNVTPPL